MELADRYIYKIYEEKSFSAAAKRLYVSQPSLSAMIAKKEERLGFRIFERGKGALSLTREGELYIDYLKELQESEGTLRHRIRMLSESDYGELALGGSGQSAYHLFPSVLHAFHEQYPHASVTLDMGSMEYGASLFDKLERGELDLLAAYSYDPTVFEPCLSIRERMVFACHKALAEERGLLSYAVTANELCAEDYPPEKELLDLSPLKSLPFFSFSRAESSIKGMIALLPSDCQFSPCHVRNSKNLFVHYSLAHQRVGATVIADLHIKDALFESRDMVFFLPKADASYRVLHLLRKKDGKKNELADAFLSLTREIFDTRLV